MRVHFKSDTSARVVVKMLHKIGDGNIPTLDSFMSHGPELALSIVWLF